MSHSTTFSGPRLKLQRAKHHILDFNTRAKSLIEARDAHFIVKDYPETHERALCVDIDSTVPIEFSLIAGDAIHNLRSALDHVTWDIVKRFGPPKPDAVQFPFTKERSRYEAMLTQRQIHLAGKEIFERFREFAPYPGGNDLLYALHQLDIADKHQLILTVRSLVAFDKLKIRDFDENAPDVALERQAFTRIHEDDRIAAWRYDPNIPFVEPQTENNTKLVVQILFREQPLAFKSVPAALRDMAVLVESIINRLS